MEFFDLLILKVRNRNKPSGETISYKESRYLFKEFAPEPERYTHHRN